MNNTKFAKNISIGIIGAGAAGLSAANALKQKGYKNITILEKLARAGGKSHTVFIGDRSYELGTAFFAAYYKNTFKLLQQFDLNFEWVDWSAKNFNPDGSRATVNNSQIIKAIGEMLFYFPLIAFRYRRIYQPGFTG